MKQRCIWNAAADADGKNWNLSRELSDKEILDVNDELILNRLQRCPVLALKEKVQLVRNCFILSANLGLVLQGTGG